MDNFNLDRTVNVIIPTHNIGNTPTFNSNNFGCRFLFACFAIATIGYILTLTFIAIIRYLYTCYQWSKLTLKWMCYTIALIWLFAIVITLPNLLQFWGSYLYYERAGICIISFARRDQNGIELSYKLTIGFLVFVLSWLIMLYCYVSVYAVYREFSNPRAVTSFRHYPHVKKALQEANVSYNYKKEFKISLYFFAVYLLHFISFLPFVIWNFAQITDAIVPKSLYPFYVFLILTCIPASLVNPLILIARYKSVRMYLGCLKRTAVPIISVQSSSLYNDTGREDSRLTIEYSYSGYYNNSMIDFNSEK